MYERNKIVKYFHAYFSQLETNYIFLRAVARNLRQNSNHRKHLFFTRCETFTFLSGAEHPARWTFRIQRARNALRFQHVANRCTWNSQDPLETRCVASSTIRPWELQPARNFNQAQIINRYVFLIWRVRACDISHEHPVPFRNQRENHILSALLCNAVHHTAAVIARFFRQTFTSQPRFCERRLQFVFLFLQRHTRRHVRACVCVCVCTFW